MCYCENAPRGASPSASASSAQAKVSIHFPPPDPPVLQLSDGDAPSLWVRCPLPSRSWDMQTSNVPLAGESVAVLKQLRTLYPDQVRLVHRDFPLPAHPGGQPAAAAAHCAYEQGEFWAYHDALFSRLSMPVEYLQLANDLKLDTEAFQTCLSSGRPQAAVSKDIQDARRLGISGTPTFFVNGRYLSGFQTLEARERRWTENLSTPLL